MKHTTLNWWIFVSDWVLFAILVTLSSLIGFRKFTEQSKLPKKDKNFFEVKYDWLYIELLRSIFHF